MLSNFYFSVKRNNCKNIRMIFLASIFLLFFIHFLTVKTFCDVNKAKTIFVIGDSRTCSLVNSLQANSSYKYKYCNINEPFYDAVITNGENTIVILGESGGYLKKGSFDRSIKRMEEYININPSVLNTEMYFYDLYGINDLIFDKNNRYSIPSEYLQRDREISILYPQIKKVFHFNAGPISEEGLFGRKGFLTNELIDNYNKCFLSNSNVGVIDFNSYLKYCDYETLMDIPENNEKTGIHYDLPTDYKIMEFITALSQ